MKWLHKLFPYWQKLNSHQKDAYRNIYNKDIRVYGHKIKGASIVPYLCLAATFIIIEWGTVTAVLARFWSLADGQGLFITIWQMVTLQTPMGWIADGIATFFGAPIGYKCVQHWYRVNIGKNPRSLPRFPNDSYLMNPKDLPGVPTFSIRADAGAWSRSPAQPSGLICHLPIKTGDLFHSIGTFKVIKRVHKTHTVTLTDNTGRDYQKVIKRGTPLRDPNTGKYITENLPKIDEKFSQALLTTSFVPKRRKMRHHYDPFKLKYNPDHHIGKANYDNVGQVIQHDWFRPGFEVERPGGIYVVDIAPDNTMVLAMTRAGKGQTIIEPTIDMWTRQLHKWNVVVNDPKGELYQEFYYPASRRGYQVIAFNLINERRTSIYNPLGYAVAANRRGDSQKAGQLISAIGSIFFPVTKGTDPMWPHAANAAFKRSALGLIDYYQDADNDMRSRAVHEHWNPSILHLRLDKLWTHVCLYNVYKMMTTLASKHSSDIGDKKNKNDLGFICITRKEKKERQNLQASGQDISKDYLTLFFDALQKLPTNAIRTAAIDQDNNLRSMSKSEKTLSSVYGIALSGMNFFTQDTISRLTSGRPSQNFDMEGLGFPRRIQVRFDHDYMTNGSHYLAGQRFKWDAFRGKPAPKSQKIDPSEIGKKQEDGRIPQIFRTEEIGNYRNNQGQQVYGKYHTDRLFYLKKYQGPDFVNTGDIDGNGWAPFIFKGKFKDNVSYLRLRIFNAKTHELQETYYFQFIKDYLKSVDGTTYVEDPVTHKMIVHGGVLHEMKKVPAYDKNGNPIILQKQTRNQKGKPITIRNMLMRYNFANTTYEKKRISLVQNKKKLPDYDPESKNYDPNATELSTDQQYDFKSYKENVRAFSQTSVHYSEKPKMVFFITPPHMQQYARIILILLDQMFNVQVSRSYMTKKNQKPLYGTNYMLDEVGNLRSQGKGIPHLDQKESIGLGQDQRYTLILQTVQQLRDIYGEHIDKVLQGNTKNIIYLKSTDDSMINLLSKMSGTTHVRGRSGLSYHRDYRKMINQTGGQAGFNWGIKKIPLISPDTFREIPRDSSIVIGHDEPIESRRQCALPMSWRLLKVQNSLHNYSFTTVPSTINNDAFNPLQNIPNFYKMVTTRVHQARLAPTMMLRYKKAHNMNDAQISRIDDEVLSKELMANINAQLRYYKLQKIAAEKAKAARDRNDMQESQQNEEAMQSINPSEMIKNEEAEKMSGDIDAEDKREAENNYGDNDRSENKATTQFKKYSDKVLAALEKKKFANGHFAATDFEPYAIGKGGIYALDYTRPFHNYDNVIATAYSRTIDAFRNDPKFQVTSDGSLILRKGTKHVDPNAVLIVNAKNSKKHKKAMKELKKNGMVHFNSKNNDNDNAHTEDANSILTKYIVTDNGINYLASLDSWSNIANGEFDQEMARADKELQAMS